MRNARFMTLALMVTLGVALVTLGQNPQVRGQAAKATGAGRTAGAPAAGSKSPAKAPQAKGSAASKSPASGSADRRDPFVSTIRVDQAGQIPLYNCPPGGVRSILVGQAELDGVVQTTAGMIAVITTTTRGRTYFLREEQKLCNGRVLQITPDSIIFEEDLLDPSGRLEKREVIKNTRLSNLGPGQLVSP